MLVNVIEAMDRNVDKTKLSGEYNNEFSQHAGFQRDSACSIFLSLWIHFSMIDKPKPECPKVVPYPELNLHFKEEIPNLEANRRTKTS